MERTIGKLFWLNIFIVCFAHAEIVMRIIDEEGAQLESVGIGRPFNISVELKNLSNGLREPIIENLGAIEHYRSGVQMSTVNGDMSAVYTYKCRIDTLGTHTIGPATIPGTQESSQQLIITALDEPKYVRSPKKEDTSVVFRIFGQPESVVVGQKVKIITRFYTTDARMRLQNMTIPQMPAFKFIDKVGPSFGKETINGRAYEYTEWSIDLFAHEAGNHLVPAFCADYEYPSQSRFSMFSWGHFAQTKRVYSNSIRINVDALPKGVRIDFVGSKATARASVNQSSAKVGEGILYTITFSGDGDIESVCAPKLYGIPDCLKLYESKSSEIPATSDRLASKQFEYVIQCVQEGSWEIPAQNFSVYDVQDHTVKTVSTSPVRITILSDQNKSEKSTLNEIQNNQVARPDLERGRNDLQVNNEDDLIRPLHTNDPWYPTPERGPINWSLFFMLVFAPCAYGIYGATRRRLASKIDAKKRAKKAAALALASLERAKKVKDYEAPYHIFITFLANIYEVKQAQISGDWIRQKIVENTSSESGVHEWDQFFASLTACAFGGAVDTTVFEVTAKWIEKWPFPISLKLHRSSDSVTSGLIIILLSGWSLQLFALNGQETFLQGNKAYQEHDYENALNLYSKIEKKGSAVWYNIGNCHYHLGHEADAIACWKRSQKGGSASLCTDSACNIDTVLQESEQNKTSFVNKLAYAWNAGSVLMIQLIFLLIWMVLCCAHYLSKRGKKYKVATFVFGVLILPFGANLVYRYIHRNDGYAIVHAEAQLYAGPNEQYHVVGTVGPKEQLVVYTKNDNWYKVASGKQNGWINARSIVVI